MLPVHDCMYMCYAHVHAGINLGHLCVLILLGHTNNASGNIKLWIERQLWW